jgi:hypothetical protein
MICIPGERKKGWYATQGEAARATEAAVPEVPKLPAFFYRLSPRAQRSYLKSDAIDRYNFIPSAAALARAQAMLRTLESSPLAAINQSAQMLVNEVCRVMRVEAVRVEIRGVRPRDPRSELHGIFYPNARPPRMVVWMRTAQRQDVVKPKTFLRTLMHELGHYLDYAFLDLGDSFHTKGFFKRESFLVRALYSPLPESGPARSREPGTP